MAKDITTKTLLKKMQSLSEKEALHLFICFHSRSKKRSCEEH